MLTVTEDRVKLDSHFSIHNAEEVVLDFKN